MSRTADVVNRELEEPDGIAGFGRAQISSHVCKLQSTFSRTVRASTSLGHTLRLGFRVCHHLSSHEQRLIERSALSMSLGFLDI